MAVVTMTDAKEQLDRLSTCCGCADDNPTDMIHEAVERARVVGVLDAWVASHGAASVRLAHAFPGDACLEWLLHVGSKMFEGATPDAARAAAAKAIESGEV